MKRIIFGACLMATLGVFGFGQKQKDQPAMNGRNTLLESGVRLDGQLQSTLDVKKSRIGDEVVLKTTKSFKQNGQVLVPKGSRLIGRITDVQQRSNSNSESRLAMVFDRLEGKNLSVPLNASIVSITNAAANARLGETSDADIFATSGTSARSSTGSSSGGLLGGVTSTAGGVLNGATRATGGLLNTTSQTVGNATGSIGQTVNGIQISNALNGSAQSSTTLSSPNRNLKVEKGATIQLQTHSSAQVH